MTTSKLAKNWPSSVFGRLINESTNVENPLHLQGVFGDLAKLESGRQPKHYESPALTAELQAQTIEKIDKKSVPRPVIDI